MRLSGNNVNNNWEGTLQRMGKIQKMEGGQEFYKWSGWKMIKNNSFEQSQDIKEIKLKKKSPLMSLSKMF